MNFTDGRYIELFPHTPVNVAIERISRSIRFGVRRLPISTRAHRLPHETCSPCLSVPISRHNSVEGNFVPGLFSDWESHQPAPASSGGCDQWLLASSKTLIRANSSPIRDCPSVLDGWERGIGHWQGTVAGWSSLLAQVPRYAPTLLFVMSARSMSG